MFSITGRNRLSSHFRCGFHGGKSENDRTFRVVHSITLWLSLTVSIVLFQGIKSLIDDFKKRNQPLFFYSPHPHVLDVLNCVSLEDFDGISTMNDLENALHSEYRYFKPTRGVSKIHVRIVDRSPEFSPITHIIYTKDRITKKQFRK